MSEPLFNADKINAAIKLLPDGESSFIVSQEEISFNRMKSWDAGKKYFIGADHAVKDSTEVLVFCVVSGKGDNMIIEQQGMVKCKFTGTRDSKIDLLINQLAAFYNAPVLMEKP